MEGQRIPRLSLDLLRGFRAAARHLSFTRAARELFVTQSAISLEVRKLEQQLGTPLFARANRSLRLTQAGERLYRVVDEALGLIEAATAELVGAGRTLTVTTSVPLASLWLTPRLPGFLREHPEINLRVVASNDPLDLERESVDLAIRFTQSGTAPPSPVKLFDVELFPVCAPALAVDGARPLRTVDDLAHHVRLEFETVRSSRSWYDWDQWSMPQQIRRLKFAGTQRFSHYDQVVGAAIAGSGVAIGKWPHLEHQLQQGVLVAPLGSAATAMIGSYYVVTPGGTAEPAVQSFVDWLHAQVQSDLRQRSRRQRPVRATRSSKARARRR
jgi:DNA-binding transcriptional LysR family regulator